MANATKMLPSLATGDNLSREEFIEIWEQLPDIKRAELIGGMVLMPSPTTIDHGDMDNNAAGWICYYKAMTPGCAGGSNSTIFLLDDVPQPDANLRIITEFGGKSWVEGKYLHGSPELLLEVCNTTGAIDLHQKLELYEEARVQEYLVIVVQKKEIRWHRLVKGKYKLLTADAQGVFRSVAFPGLWLDRKALFADDIAKVIASLQSGIDSDDHQKFVDDLAKRKRAAKK